MNAWEIRSVHGIDIHSPNTIWYHGTTPEDADSILRTGFRVSPIAQTLGQGVYVGPRHVALPYAHRYDKVTQSARKDGALIMVKLRTPPIDWKSERCAAVRRKCSFPTQYNEAIALIIANRNPHPLHTRLTEMMMQPGIHAVWYGDPSSYMEVCIYDLQAMEIVGVVALPNSVPGTYGQLNKALDKAPEAVKKVLKADRQRQQLEVLKWMLEVQQKQGLARAIKALEVVYGANT